jgi:hypothetical protein
MLSARANLSIDQHATSLHTTALGVSPYCIGLERTTVNPATETMVVQSCNVTGSSLMTVEETCEYKRHAENPQWTQYKQEARITSFLPMFTGRALESHSFKSMTATSGRGLLAIETLCQQVNSEGLDSLQNFADTFTKFTSYILPEAFNGAQADLAASGQTAQK